MSTEVWGRAGRWSEFLARLDGLPARFRHAWATEPVRREDFTPRERSRVDLSFSLRRGRAEVAVVGELSGEMAAQFLDVVERAIAAGARSVVVHLGEAEIVDDAGLRAVAIAATQLEARRGELVLKSPRHHTLTLLATAGLDRDIPIW